MNIPLLVEPFHEPHNICEHSRNIWEHLVNISIEQYLTPSGPSCRWVYALPVDIDQRHVVYIIMYMYC